MTGLCHNKFKYEKTPKKVEKLTCSFVVQSNESACRKSGHVDMDPVIKEDTELIQAAY